MDSDPFVYPFAVAKRDSSRSKSSDFPSIPESSRRLEWVCKGKSERRYELHADRLVCGVLTFARGHSSLAVARTSIGAWSFKRIGFFSTAVTVRMENSDAFLALFNPRATKTHGVLNVPKGQEFLWNDHFWAESNPRSSAGGKPIVIFHETSGPSTTPRDPTRNSASVEIEPLAKSTRELPLLLTLGWYLILLQHQDRDIVRALSSGKRIGK